MSTIRELFRSGSESPTRTPSPPGGGGRDSAGRVYVDTGAGVGAGVGVAASVNAMLPAAIALVGRPVVRFEVIELERVRNTAFRVTRPSSILLGLGPNNWRLFIDYKDHDRGEDAYDKGPRAEPGFRSSALAALSLAAAQLDTHPNAHPTFDFYLSLHRSTTHHFTGHGYGQLGTAEYVSGRFRSPREFAICALPVSQMHPDGKKDAIENLSFAFDPPGGRLPKSEYLRSLLDCFTNAPLDLPQYVRGPYDPLLSIYSTRRFAKIGVDISYNFPINQISDAVEYLFSHFQEEMTQLEATEKEATPEQLPGLREEKLMYISALFQKLEWIHPFLDGQGRTDLIFLNYLLVRYGFTPVILEHPYYSSTATLEHWIEHLKQGMARWQQECAGA